MTNFKFTSDECRVSEVTKIHTVDGGVITVDGNFIIELCNQPLKANLQNFQDKIIVNINNVTYMEVVSDDE